MSGAKTSPRPFDLRDVVAVLGADDKPIGHLTGRVVGITGRGLYQVEFRDDLGIPYVRLYDEVSLTKIEPRRRKRRFPIQRALVLAIAVLYVAIFVVVAIVLSAQSRSAGLGTSGTYNQASSTSLAPPSPSDAAPVTR